MEKEKSKLLTILKILSGITIVVVIILFIIAYQIGVEGLKDKSARSTIISGLFSMIGGIAGAFGAYFIAKWQLNVVLDRQYEKEKSKFAWEIRVNKKLEVVQILNTKINDLDDFRKEYLNYNTELNSYLEKKIKQDPNIKEIRLLQGYSEKTVKSIDMLSDILLKFKVLFSYESFYSDAFWNLLVELDEELLDFLKEIAKHFPKKNWEVVRSTDDFLTNWRNENATIGSKFEQLDTKFYNLVDQLNAEISETLPD